MKPLFAAVILQNLFVLHSVAAPRHLEPGRQSQMQPSGQRQKQPKTQSHIKSEPPPQPQPSTKLAVIISLDQFPYEYLTRFGPYFSDRGFNYLISHGANFTNARYEHAYTKTSPGHAAISTGTYSHLNGITSNRWYDRVRKKAMNSVDDETVQLLGARGIGRSPRNLLTNTVGDMLMLHTNFRSKVISIGEKDRSAVLMGGKFGKAFWFDDSVAVTSNYYYPALPGWVEKFNHSGIFQSYLGREWTEVAPSQAGEICDQDDVPYEGGVAGIGNAFPHTIRGGSADHPDPKYYELLAYSPFSTEILLDGVRRAFTAESLGTRGVTDMLCVGVAATDLIGHVFGPASHEVFDNAMRTDSMLSGFLSFLDDRVGLSNCVIAMTSDHGIAPIPEYIRKKNPHYPAGRVGLGEITRLTARILGGRFAINEPGTKWIEQVIDEDIYLNRDLLKQKNIPFEEAMKTLKDSLSALPQFAAAYTRDEIEHSTVLDRIGMMIRRTYYPSRSGDVMFILRPFFINGSDSVGTSHGQPYDYDTHVLLIMFGKNFKPGNYPEEVSPVDLAPTLSEVLQIEFPPMREGRVLQEAIR
jgi:predicted AlkP superfamily pyrophosphatase or phosphodiesterase